MTDSFDFLEYAAWIRLHSRLILITCMSAGLLTAAVSFALPKRYTATASIIIEPPGGVDPRAATAVSPVYFESLKTYERFASSDTLFVRALERLGMRNEYPGRSVESLKHSVLKISKPANTKILEITTTLPNPAKAQALAQFLAEQTVLLNRSLQRRAAEDLAREPREILNAAQKRLEVAQKAGDEFTNAQPVETLAKEVDSTNEQRNHIERSLGEIRATVADLVAQEKTYHPGDGLEQQAEWIRREIVAAQARIGVLEQQQKAISEQSARKGPMLEHLKLQRELLTSELKAAQAGYESAKAKFSDIRSSFAFQGERLEVLDPGIVPERPSSPNIPLNIVIALVLSSVASLSYLSVRFGHKRMRQFHAERTYSVR
jgi:uncharacterized protein involved in exopolysaccharide biosynthesis